MFPAPGMISRAMLRLLPPTEALQFREFFEAARYTQQEFQRRAILKELPKRTSENLSQLAAPLQEPTVLNLLLRLFLLGVPAKAEEADRLLPAAVLQSMRHAGLLSGNGDMLAAEVLLTPCDGRLFAADTFQRLSEHDPDFVVWPNPTSRLLSQFTMRRPVESTLDLGTGCGIQAVLAAAHSGEVTATDLNPRAAEFVAFNARLNGVKNVACLTGDTFEPVAGRTFDRIVANPPFFVTPSAGPIYCENPLELDGYCRRVVREAPRHLKEGGYLQMVFEWVKRRGEDWQDRLREWAEGTGCDVWIFRGYARLAAAYASERIQQSVEARLAAETLEKWTTYYREKEVEEIHGGILAMRRRRGANWIRFEEMLLDPGDAFGEAVWQAFAGVDFLEDHASDEALLSSLPRLSPHARLEQKSEQVNGRWQAVDTRVSLAAGIPANIRVQPPVADFLARLDGTHTLQELIADLSGRVRADRKSVERECLGVVRRLINTRFITE